MDELIRIFAIRGDLAHLALFLWASVATTFALLALRELIAAARRFDDFVRELSRLNERFRGRD
jgi:DNA-binding GntR family transcriptional regulator